MKKIFCIILSVVFIFSLVSCGISNENFKDGVTISDFSASITPIISDLDLTRASESFVAVNYSGIDLSLCKEYAIYISQKGNADQYGVFICNSTDDAEKIKSDAESYLKNIADNWMSEYLPEDTAKINSASVIQKGKYVLFSILDDSNKTAVENAFSETVKA